MTTRLYCCGIHQ